jgi:hypothetical protein
MTSHHMSLLMSDYLPSSSYLRSFSTDMRKMLPLNRYLSPFSPFRSSPSPRNFSSPFQHISPSTNPPHPDAEIENLFLRSELPQCSFHTVRDSLFITRSPFHSLPRDRRISTESSLYIRLRVLIASPCSNGTLRQIDNFVATTPISATIEDVYDSLAREVDRTSMSSMARHVEIRVYAFDGQWERLALFRDVLELPEEKGVEGLVVMLEC